MPCILACAGGSIGHLAPLVAVCRAVRSRDPAVRIVVVCAAREQERTFLQREGFAPVGLPSPRSPLGFLRAFRRSFALLRECSPSVVFGKGGAVSIPLCLAAWWKGIPVVIHESDAVMGRTNRFLSRFADTVCLGFPQHVSRAETSHEQQANEQRVIVTGNPVRTEILTGSRAEGLRRTGFSGTRPILLVIGGSQGAQAINEVVVALLPELIQLCDVVHITGPGKLPASRFPLPAHDSYWSTEFAHDTLPHLYAAATVALSRAGAGVLSELAAHGIPSIIVPLRGLAQDHQWHNAEVFAASGGAIFLSQENLVRLPSILSNLLKNPETISRMSAAISSLSHPEAAQRVAEILVRCSGIFPHTLSPNPSPFAKGEGGPGAEVVASTGELR